MTNLINLSLGTSIFCFIINLREKYSPLINFSGISAVKKLCSRIESSEKVQLRYLDMKYSRVSQDMKKSLGEVCKKMNIDLKVW